MQYLRNIPDFSEMLQFPKFFSAYLDRITLYDSTVLSVIALSELIKRFLFSGITNALKFVSTSLTVPAVFHLCYVLVGCCQGVEQKSYFCDRVARYWQYFKLLWLKEAISTLSIIKDDFSKFYFLSLAA